MSRLPSPRGQITQLEAEDTIAGVQTLVPGMVPVTLGDRLAVLANAPMLPTRVQRAADLGLFDTNARNQLEMF
ncbi:hypothetical protein GRI58_15225 [Porphyrobacter algicida]|uniref:Uncharacterized protein n=1 Tax=Qipengyuania algicida TaxID=1836209 RepID=A0A845AIS4_9SPHN|nr:hypothetical protein [Qipengyuania algicida]MXP30160.1 hypothetical protein [Qipengyuania algicida]